MQRTGAALGSIGLAVAVGACSGLYTQNTVLIEQHLPGLVSQAQALQKERGPQSRTRVTAGDYTTSYRLFAGGNATYAIDVVTTDAKATQNSLIGIDVQIQTAKDTYYGLQLSQSRDGWELRQASQEGGESSTAHITSPNAAKNELDSMSVVLTDAANDIPATPALEQAIYNFAQPPQS
ncbi:MAG TPA: hypothetical protein VIM53_05175 [Candidatus Saccharimonadales bacterium]